MFSDNANEDTQFCHFYRDTKDKVNKSLDGKMELWIHVTTMDNLLSAVPHPWLLISILRHSSRRFTTNAKNYLPETLWLAQGVRIPFRSFLIRKT